MFYLRFQDFYSWRGGHRFSSVSKQKALQSFLTLHQRKQTNKPRLETNDSVTVPAMILHSCNSDCPNKTLKYSIPINRKTVVSLSVLKAPCTQSEIHTYGSTHRMQFLKLART